MAQAKVRALAYYDRVALQWKGDTGSAAPRPRIQAAYGAAGHVWNAASGDIAKTARGESGFLVQPRPVRRPNAMMAEIYSFPAGTTTSGRIALPSRPRSPQPIAAPRSRRTARAADGRGAAGARHHARCPGLRQRRRLSGVEKPDRRPDNRQQLISRSHGVPHEKSVCGDHRRTFLFVCGRPLGRSGRDPAVARRRDRAGRNPSGL